MDLCFWNVDASGQVFDPVPLGDGGHRIEKTLTYLINGKHQFELIDAYQPNHSLALEVYDWVYEDMKRDLSQYDAYIHAIDSAAQIIKEKGLEHFTSVVAPYMTNKRHLMTAILEKAGLGSVSGGARGIGVRHKPTGRECVWWLFGHPGQDTLDKVLSKSTSLPYSTMEYNMRRFRRFLSCPTKF